MEIIRSEIESIWENFEKSCLEKTPYDLKYWKNFWIKHFGQNYKLEFIYNDSFFIPLKIEDNIGSIIGGKDIVDYNNILYLPDKSNFEEFLEKIFQTNIQTLRLFSILKNSTTFDLFSKIEINKNYQIEFQEEDVSPYLKLPNNWENYLAQLEKKKRHELRRKIRRLEQNTEFSTGDYDSSVHSEEILEEFFRLHKISSVHKNTFMNKDREAFFRDLMEYMINRNLLIYSYLKVNDKTVACSISFLYENRRYLYNSGFDPEYDFLSVGLLNHAFSIKRSIERKIDIFDFMRGDERYKYDLGAIDNLLYTIEVSNNK